MRTPTLLLYSLAALGCASKPDMRAPPAPVVPFPGSQLAGQTISLWPLVTMRADSTLGWKAALEPRRQALGKVDSILASQLTTRRSQIKWVLPADLRRAAQQAPGLLPDPDLMATVQLQTHVMAMVPEPLRAQLRQLTGVASGGSYALVPANLVVVREPKGGGRARMVITLVNVRLGAVSWTATVTGVGRDPWEAVDGAVKHLLSEVL